MRIGLMGSPRLSVRIVQGVLLLFVPPTVVAGGVAILLYSLDLHHHRLALFVTILVGGAAMVAYLAFMIHGMGESLGTTLREMQLDTEIMATVNPAHRLLIQTGDELESLAVTINQLGERLNAAQDGLEGSVALATEEMRGERNFLARVLEAADAAITVVTPDGLVGLANPAARVLLASEGPAIVGRNLSDLVDAEDARQILTCTRTGLVGGPVLVRRRSDGASLEVAVATLPTGDGREDGVVLVLRETVRPARHGADTVSETAGESSSRENTRRTHVVGAGARSPTGAGNVSSRLPLYETPLFNGSVGLADRPQLERPILELSCVVLDTETTGLNLDGRDRIVSLAGVRVRGGAVRHEDVFDALVNPCSPIPPASAEYHGITDAMVAAAPPIDAILPEFLRFARGAVLVGHQVWFDLRILDRESLRLGLSPLAHAHVVLDTLLLARLVNGSLADLGLEGLSHRFGVAVEGRHSALGDALATAEIYVRLLKLLRSRGIVTLGQILDSVARLRNVGVY